MKYIGKYIWCQLLSYTHASHVHNVGVHYSHYKTMKGSASLIISLTRPCVFVNTENSRPATMFCRHLGLRPGITQGHIQGGA